MEYWSSNSKWGSFACPIFPCVTLVTSAKEGRAIPFRNAATLKQKERRAQRRAEIEGVFKNIDWTLIDSKFKIQQRYHFGKMLKTIKMKILNSFTLFEFRACLCEKATSTSSLVVIDVALNEGRNTCMSKVRKGWLLRREWRGNLSAGNIKRVHLPRL